MPACVHVSRYFCRAWHESRGDDHNDWGPATYWFETDDDLVPQRQIEVYEAGQRLLYDDAHPEDEHGGLATGTLRGWDGASPETCEVGSADFEAEWERGRRT